MFFLTAALAVATAQGQGASPEASLLPSLDKWSYDAGAEAGAASGELAEDGPNGATVLVIDQPTGNGRASWSTAMPVEGGRLYRFRVAWRVVQKVAKAQLALRIDLRDRETREIRVTRLSTVASNEWNETIVDIPTFEDSSRLQLDVAWSHGRGRVQIRPI
ncbi:MAG: hypothetical protein ACOC9P_02160, partial [bacterium]